MRGLNYFLDLRLIKHTFVGGVSMIVDLLIFGFLVQSLHYQTSLFLSGIFGGFTNFLLSKYWNFKSKGAFFRELSFFSLSIGLYIGATSLLMFLLVGVFSLPEIASKIFVMGFLMVLSFAFQKSITFRG